MTHTLARSLVSLASPILFFIYLWNDLKTLSMDDQHPALSWFMPVDQD
ncbi:MAG: hypothetical protein LW878_03155 [Proteobacteria bacterium]|nr:hypothetical protein [Pseudomonadota bacterium]